MHRNLRIGNRHRQIRQYRNPHVRLRRCRSVAELQEHATNADARK
jgi:hypothetical protein